MNQNFHIAAFSNDPVSFDELKRAIVRISRQMAKGEILELADALHDELRERRDSPVLCELDTGA
jgi:hypothetical protein